MRLLLSWSQLSKLCPDEFEVSVAVFRPHCKKWSSCWRFWSHQREGAGGLQPLVTVQRSAITSGFWKIKASKKWDFSSRWLCPSFIYSLSPLTAAERQKKKKKKPHDLKCADLPFKVVSLGTSGQLPASLDLLCTTMTSASFTFSGSRRKCRKQNLQMERARLKMILRKCQQGSSEWPQAKTCFKQWEIIKYGHQERIFLVLLILSAEPPGRGFRWPASDRTEAPSSPFSPKCRNLQVKLESKSLLK